MFGSVPKCRGTTPGPFPELSLTWDFIDITVLVSHVCPVVSRKSTLDHNLKGSRHFLRMPADREAILFGEREKDADHPDFKFDA